MHAVSIRVDSVKKRFFLRTGVLDVLKGVTYTFHSGRSYAVTGASGTGKSTLLHMLAGLSDPSEGAVFFDEHNILLFSEPERDYFLNHTLGLLFQMPYLIKELTVLENVMVKGLISDADGCKEEAYMLLEQVGLADKAHELPSMLSGGQQQRVALARALFGKPSFLLADEPTGNLDAKSGQLIIDLLLSCKNLWGMGIIVNTHDPAVAQRMETVLDLKEGLLVEQALSKEI